MLTFPVMRLAEAERRGALRPAGGGTWRGFAYELDGATVWGATGWMLHTLLETIRKETTWPIGVNAVAPEDGSSRILRGEARTIAVVGLSSKPGRAVARRRGLPAGTGVPDRAGEPA